MEANRFPRLVMPRVVRINRLFYTSVYSEKFHADADNELLHIIDGSMRLCLDSGEEFFAGKSDTLFIPHGVRHKDIFEISRGLEIFHLSFKWKEADRFFKEARPDCLKDLPSKDKNELLLLFDMLRLDRYDLPENLALADARLGHLLGIAWRHIFKPDREVRENDNYSRMVAFAHNYMNAHLSERIDIDRVAEYLKVSRSTLLRAFRHASGMSFNSYLCSIRMQQANNLLRERALNLAECAARCGYNDPAYFSRCFKKHFGFLPKNLK